MYLRVGVDDLECREECLCSRVCKHFMRRRHKSVSSSRWIQSYCVIWDVFKLRCCQSHVLGKKGGWSTLPDWDALSPVNPRLILTKKISATSNRSALEVDEIPESALLKDS